MQDLLSNERPLVDFLRGIVRDGTAALMMGMSNVGMRARRNTNAAVD